MHPVLKENSLSTFKAKNRFISECNFCRNFAREEGKVEMQELCLWIETIGLLVAELLKAHHRSLYFTYSSSWIPDADMMVFFYVDCLILETILKQF